MLAIRDAKILTATGENLEKGTILIEDGRIVALGDVEIPEGAEIIEGQGSWVTPGLIEAHSHIGVWGEPGTRGGITDGKETAENPLTPHIRALDGFYINDLGIESARRAGFTSICTLPGSGNVIGGTGFAYKLRDAERVEELMIPGTEVMKMALGETPRFNFGTKGKSPKTRMGVGGVLREILFDARGYSDALLSYEKGELSSPPKANFRLEALVPVVRGEMLCRIHCHRSDDIATAIRIAKEFNLKYALEHVTEGYKVLNTLKEVDVFCVIGPLNMGPANLCRPCHC